MRTERITPEDALLRAGAFPYAYFTEYSRAYLGRNTEKPDPAELIEARFFGGDAELRLYRTEKGWEALLLSEEEGDEFIDAARRLLPAFGQTLTVRRVLDIDEDGQAYIRYTRLAGWKGDTADV